MPELSWLPKDPKWRDCLRAAEAGPEWRELVALANYRLDFLQTATLDRVLCRQFSEAPPPGLALPPVRLAVLATSTVDHLLPALRVAALRRGLWMATFIAPYGQIFQTLHDPASPLHAFSPDFVLFAQDTLTLAGADLCADPGAAAEHALTEMAAQWRQARDGFGAAILQQSLLPLPPPLLGETEERLAGSPASIVAAINRALPDRAEAARVDLVALDRRVAQDGLRAWHDPALWYHARQEIGPAASAFYGDLVVRLIAARRGISAKCLVLDLDNTLWGGVAGDDGLGGIVLGPGTGAGEAYAAFQHYARALSARGIVLAVASKNDAATAFEIFERHPGMVLTRADIASFQANWNDKPANLRAIAAELGLGLDAFVFVDDNPFERNLVRAELPMVRVPELPDDPAGFARMLADAGYFEAVTVTAEDRARGALYRAEAARKAVAESATDLATYLGRLEMRLLWRSFDRPGLARIVQLINKTNQYNLTTRRYAEDEILALIDDPNGFGLQLRLIDRFGDNGMIAVVIARRAGDDEARFDLDTWLMSCRVLGREVERATLDVVMAEARRRGARRLLGRYVPGPRNDLVRDHYEKLGFVRLPCGATDGDAERWLLELDAAPRHAHFMTIEEE